MPLELSQIINASMQVIEDQGLKKLSMRALARELGVQAPSIYWHIKSKQELLNLLATAHFQRAMDQTPKASHWQQWLEDFGHAFFNSLLKQRDGALLSSSYAPGKEMAAMGFSHGCKPMMDLGLENKDALMFLGSVIALATGWALHLQQDGVRESLEAVINPKESFNLGLSALVQGLSKA